MNTCAAMPAGWKNVSPFVVCLLLALSAAAAPVAWAQAPLPTQPVMPPVVASPPPAYPPAELDRIVSPIALYPDPLLAQVLAAATFAADIPDAARWADEHHYLTGSQLTAAMAADRLSWDPSVQALLPFPSILEMMASSMPWTEELGNAFLAQRDDVMDAVQRRRHQAQQYGYLRSNGGIAVRNQGPDVCIQTVDPFYVPVPYYDPYLVYGPPPPGMAVGAGIYLGFGVRLGAWFAPWGWGSTQFVWPTHTLVIGGAPWGRTWINRGNYLHPYPNVPRYTGPRLPDRHPPTPRTPAERARPSGGAGRRH